MSRTSNRKDRLTLFGRVAFVVVMACGASASGQSPASIWDGVFTSGQASRGAAYVLDNCSGCHGTRLEGTVEGRPLVGEPFWNSWSERTVDSLLDYVSTNMPYSMDGRLEGSLPEATYVDIVAYMLERSGLPAADRELTWDSGEGVEIVPQDGPGELPEGALAEVVGCLAREDGQWLLTQATRPMRSESAPEASADSPLGNREIALMYLFVPLDSYAGHKMVARGLLIGEGGVDGLNVSTVSSVSETCE